VPLTPGEDDRLLLHLQAGLAQRRRDRGLRLNVPEARALIADAVCEWARDGLTWRQARDLARSLLAVDDVLPGVPDALAEVRVEARFDDGTRLMVVTDPFRQQDEQINQQNELARAQAGSSDLPDEQAVLEVTNHARTDIGLTSHIHLAEVNPRLRLDRAAAYGMRPAIPAGATLWIAAGTTRTVPIVPIGGARMAYGTTGLIDGHLDDPVVRERFLRRLQACGYLDRAIPADDADAEITNAEIAGADTAVVRVMAERRARDHHG